MDNSFKKGRYTKHSNKIGLFSSSKGSFIKNDTGVVLNFPFKDTVLEQDAWKEEALIGLADKSKIVFDAEDGDSHNYKEYLEEIKKSGYREIKNIGFKFYNTNPRSEAEFALDFEEKLWKK